jgi:membrane protein
MNFLKSILLDNKPVKKGILFLQKKSFPGYPEISWYAIIEHLIKWIDDREMTLRARSLSFSFFLALFPTSIFFFTLIAYLPLNKTPDQILFYLSQIIPKSTFTYIRTTLLDILKHQRAELLSFGFLSAIYFSTNGFHSLMNLLNSYSRQKETRSFFKQRIVAIILAITVSLSLSICVLLITGATHMLKMADKLKYFPSITTPWLLGLFNYVIVVGICITIVSTIYYLAPSKSRKFKFISAGSVFATISIIVTTTLFSVYVNAFNSYNKVYGSIGALIVVMILIYANTYILLMGFELNYTLNKTVKDLKEQKKLKQIKSNQVVLLSTISEEAVSREY